LISLFPIAGDSTVHPRLDAQHREMGDPGVDIGSSRPSTVQLAISEGKRKKTKPKSSLGSYESRLGAPHGTPIIEPPRTLRQLSQDLGVN